MRTRALAALLAAGLLALAGPGAAQDADGIDTDIGGDWHFRFAGNRGAAVLHFPGAPNFGVFEVQGAGYTTLFRRTFTVSDDAVQTLRFESNGNIRGVVALEDATHTTTIGTLTVLSGNLTPENDHVALHGTLALDGQAGRKVTLIGDRIVPPPVELAGRTFDGTLAGKRTRSVKYDIQVYEEGTTESLGIPAVVNEGHPFYLLQAGGPVRVDGAERADVRISGLIVADPRYALYGSVATTDFGGGELFGRFDLDSLETTGRPTFRAVVRTADGRRVRLTGLLQEFTAF